MVGWFALLARTPLLVMPVAVVAAGATMGVLGTYRASKWTSATILRVKSEQQAACPIAGPLGCVPLSVPFLIYREMRHAPPSISDTLAIKIGSSGMRAIREAISPALRFNAINLGGVAALAGLGHSISIALFCDQTKVQKYRAKQIAAALKEAGHQHAPAPAAAPASTAHVVSTAHKHVHGSHHPTAAAPAPTPAPHHNDSHPAPQAVAPVHHTTEHSTAAPSHAAPTEHAPAPAAAAEH